MAQKKGHLFLNKSREFFVEPKYLWLSCDQHQDSFFCDEFRCLIAFNWFADTHRSLIIRFHIRVKVSQRSSPTLPPPSMKYLVIALTTEFEEHLSRTDAQTLSAIVISHFELRYWSQTPVPSFSFPFPSFSFPVPCSPIPVLRSWF